MRSRRLAPGSSVRGSFSLGDLPDPFQRRSLGSGKEQIVVISEFGVEMEAVLHQHRVEVLGRQLLVPERVRHPARHLKDRLKPQLRGSGTGPGTRPQSTAADRPSGTALPRRRTKARGAGGRRPTGAARHPPNAEPRPTADRDSESTGSPARTKPAEDSHVDGSPAINGMAFVHAHTGYPPPPRFPGLGRSGGVQVGFGDGTIARGG